MKITSPRVLAQLKVIVLALVIAVGGSYVFAYSTWVGPTASPTNNNADTPLNVGNNTQDKLGRLRLNTQITTPDAYGLDVFGKSRFFGNLEVGTTSSPAKVKIVDGTQANGSVLVSDATGLASWKATSTLGLGGALQVSDLFPHRYMIASTFTSDTGKLSVPSALLSTQMDIYNAICPAGSNSTISCTAGTFKKTAGPDASTFLFGYVGYGWALYSDSGTSDKICSTLFPDAPFTESKTTSGWSSPNGNWNVYWSPTENKWLFGGGSFPSNSRLQSLTCTSIVSTTYNSYN